MECTPASTHVGNYAPGIALPMFFNPSPFGLGWFGLDRFGFRTLDLALRRTQPAPIVCPGRRHHTFELCNSSGIRVVGNSLLPVQADHESTCCFG
eukprot:gene8283-biopygen1577